MNKKILLVEDNMFIRDMYSKVLTDKGFLVDTAEDGQIALDKLFQQSNHYDLIILDIMLPKIDGLTILQKAKEETSAQKDTPVFMLTNLGMDNMVAEGISYGAEKYFIKADFLPQDIAKEVEEFFSTPA